MKDSKNYETRYFTYQGLANLDTFESVSTFYFYATLIFITFAISLGCFKSFNLWVIICLVAFIGVLILAICLHRSACKRDFDYTVILKENCFTIEGKPKAPWHAWPLDCTYEFDTRNLQVTICDRVGNHQTYLYNDDFKKFLEEIQKY